ncbi:MAG: histidine phosphatase family protein [Acetobacteraceae bacterium]|nr:histidine phosphatase family protein [Acetobacteraceae bacterium]
MRQLLLMRHAKSSWDDPTLSDHARPLNPRGRAAATAMRRMMHDVGLAPDLVLVSSSRRTLQTLEALEPWDDTPLVEPMDTLYLAPPELLFQALHGVAETVRSVLLLGHNPGLHDLALQLAGPGEGLMRHRLGEGFPSGALAEFNIAGTWAGLAAGGGRLTRFVGPRDLPPADDAN